ncbi:unnamed protein product [Echinostoma caproni]|uniref:Uncharacterized protein n=1 Tax=Echinostoma caproni TaxID=27848 RepID=A0A3P8HP73_9TREM|nr:unnamed protein product [Echinostoma caproni]
MITVSTADVARKSDVLYAKFCASVLNPDPTEDPRASSSKQLRHDAGPVAAPVSASATPVPPLMRNAVDPAGSTSFPDFGRSTQHYNPDPYHFYRVPPSATDSHHYISESYACRSNGSSCNPYHSPQPQFHPQQSLHSHPGSSIPAYSGSPFDPAHCRRFRQGMTGSDRYNSSYQTNALCRDPSQLYPSAEDIYARYLADSAYRSRPDVPNPLTTSHTAGSAESPMDQFSSTVDPLASWLQFQGNAQHMQ